MNKTLEQASPLVVIGMHRSGTRLVADVLADLGIFMGADQQADSESITFLLINESIMHQCGAFWSEPMSAHFVLAQPELQAHFAASARDALTAQLPNYIGASGWHPGATAANTPPFGWKDPRNTFTLPVWKQVFPNLRTLHIVRHGIDVAASLARRHAKALQSATGESVPSALTVIKDQALGVLSSRRGWTLPEALTMWEQYVEKARLESAELGERALEVRFEDVLRKPETVVSAISAFCRVPLPADLGPTLARVQASRAFAFRHDPALVEFAKTMRDVLERYGYTP